MTYCTTCAGKCITPEACQTPNDELNSQVLPFVVCIVLGVISAMCIVWVLTQ